MFLIYDFLQFANFYSNGLQQQQQKKVFKIGSQKCFRVSSDGLRPRDTSTTSDSFISSRVIGA